MSAADSMDRPAICPRCEDNELLLIWKVSEVSGKTTYTYACPSCGKSWLAPSGG